jgi:hypothetical protein
MATYISKQSGLWSSASTWLTAAAGQTTPTTDAGAPPQSGGGDKIIITNNATVEYDVVGTFGDGAYRAYGAAGQFDTDTSLIANAAIVIFNGTLKASRTQTTALTADGSIFVNFGSNIPTLDWGSSTDPISAAGVNATLTLGVPSLTSSVRFGIFNRASTLADNGTHNSRITFCGRSKPRNTTLTASHITGTTTLSVADATNWEIGDMLILEIPQLKISGGGSAPVNDIRTITGINGNVVTINTGTTTNFPAGNYVGNMSSNVTIKPGYYVENSSTPCNSFGIIIQPNGNNSLYQLKDCSFTGFIGVGANGAIFNITDGTYARRSPELENVSFYSPTAGTISTWIFNQLYGVTYPSKYKNIAIYLGTSNATEVISLRTGGSVNISDSVVYQTSRFFSGGLFLTLTNSRIFCSSRFNLSNSTASTTKINNCIVKCNAASPFISLPGTGNFLTTIENTGIHFQATNGSNGSLHTVSEGTPGVYTFRNCSLSAINYGLNTNLASSKDFACNVIYPNNDKLASRRFSSYYNLSGNYSNRNRGLASYEAVAVKPIASGVYTVFPYYYTELIPARANTPQRYVGYIKYDSTYGGTNLPYIQFTDDINTTSVTQTFSCSPVSNEWQKFDLTVTPVYDGNITMTFYAQTTSLAAKTYLDGLYFDPLCPDARHYGFVFDKNPYRTVNVLTTLTENQVSAISTVNNLDYLYDASNYWSVTNPSLTAYTDLYTQDGNILDFGSKNIVIDNSVSEAFSYVDASSTLTIKTALLSSGSNFIGLKTTGNIYLSSGSTIGEIDIYGNVFQATPVSLSGIYMEGTLAYNTDSNTTIEYTDCTMDTVQNDGTGIVTIKKTNSTIANGSDAEIVDFIPTILNVTLNGGYIAIYDDTGTKQYYQNTDGTIVLPSNATGTWTYHIARYGYQYVQGSFVVDGNVGATIEINPNYVPDNFVTSDPATVAGYGDLNTSEKIYNYLNYWTTTSSGIDYIPFYSKAFGSLTINKNVTLDAEAASILTYNGSTLLTLKCTGLSEDILFVSNGNIIDQNGTTYSDDVKIRAANLNSELILGGITSITFFPDEANRDNNTNPGDTPMGTIYRFLYGDIVSGVTLAGTIYARVDVAGTILLYSDAIATGRNELEFGTTGTLQQIVSNQKIINQGIQKASKLIPHTTNI